jgi:toxin HigB-1
MIKTFTHKGLENFFFDDSKKGIQAAHVQKLADILDRLDASQAVEDMRYPGSDLHQLKGQRKGFWAVKVSGNWRVVFTFKEGNAYEVDYLDYH